jgi:Xaa-Pro aminopeptidase
MESIYFPKSINYNFKIPTGEYKARIGNLRECMSENEIDLGIAYGTPSFSGDLLYLTGYEPQLENALVLVTQSDVIILGGPEGEGYAIQQIKAGDYHILIELRLPDEDYPNTKFDKLGKIIKGLIKHSKSKIALLTEPNVVPVGWDALIRSNLPSGTQIKNYPEILRQLRACKSQIEFQAIGYAARISVEAMRSMLGLLRPGLRELELAAEADYTMKKMGAASLGWETLVLSGQRINTVVGRASNKIIQQGELVLLGTSARFSGYASTCGRTVVVGEPSKGQNIFLNHGAKAYEIAKECLEFGAPKRFVDLKARAYLRKHGLGEYQLYSVAHGTGITECLEGEPFTQSSSGTIPKNLAEMIDVGLFNHPEYCGARFEDEFVIDAKGEKHCLSDLEVRPQ